MPHPARSAVVATPARQRRTRALLVASALFVGTVIGFASTRAHACGAGQDALARSAPLFGAVIPADCSTLLREVADFSWPAQAGRNTYSLFLTFPDGHTEMRSTAGNWLAWDAPLPAGQYRWTVKVAGDTNLTSAPRIFTVEPESWVPLAVARRDPTPGARRTAVN